MGLPAGSSRKQAPGARGLGRASPLRGDGREATIAKCGGARSARSCVLYAARSSGLRRTSRTSARPHRRSPCRRSGRAGLCRRCGSGCGGAGCKGGGGVVAASRRDAYQSTRRARGRAADVARRRCGGRWQQPSLCVGLSVGARRMASRRGANLESQRWRRAGARGAAGRGPERRVKAAAASRSHPRRRHSEQPGWRGGAARQVCGVEETKVGDNSRSINARMRSIPRSCGA